MALEPVHTASSGADDDSAIWDALQAVDDAKVAGEEIPEPVSTETTAEPTTTTTTEPDIWADAPEPLRAAFQATRQQFETAEQNHRRVAGTVSALQRQINELKSQPATTAQAAATVDVLDSPELKQAQEEYPEVVGPLVKTLKALQEQNATLAKTVTERFTSADQREAESYYIAQENALTERVPDWKEQASKPEFTTWLNQQPQYVRDGIQRNGTKIVDATEAADIIERFKSSIGAPTASQKPSAKRQQQLESAAAPQGRGSAPRITSGMEGMTDQQIWDHLDAEDRRKAKSR